MAKIDTRFCAKKGDMEIDCSGYGADDILKFLNLLGGNAIEVKIEQDEINKIKEFLKGDLDEVVSFNEDKKPKEEIIDLERTLKTAKLPTTTTDFTCPGCDQSILLINNNTTLVRDYRDKKIYDIGNVTFPCMTDEDECTINDKVVSVYSDCLGFINRTNSFVLVSDSIEKCTCPICNHQGTVYEFVKYHEEHYNDDDGCDICGCEKENIISQTGESYDCTNHCMEQLRKLNEE